jgi:hypothetical protein
MGGEVSVYDTYAKFQIADLTSHYYMTVNTPCQIVKVGNDSDSHDTYVDQYEWGWNSQQPERVAVLCRAVWHNAFFADLVTAGDGCTNYKNEQWPMGLPANWNTIHTVVNLNGNWTDGSSRSAVISVDFSSLTVDMSGSIVRPRTAPWSTGPQSRSRFRTTRPIPARFSRRTRSYGPTVRAGPRSSTPCSI